MSALEDILCSETCKHSASAAVPSSATSSENPAVDSDSSSTAETSKSALGKPPFPLGGGRRKSGWGKRFKEREQGRLAIIFPRRKLGEAARGSDAVWLSVDVLNSLSDRSLASAAKLLVSAPLNTSGPALTLAGPTPRALVLRTGQIGANSCECSPSTCA
jgi:hypothetical protein